MGMSDISTHSLQEWFLRHGKTLFNYANSKYDDFIQMLCNGHDTLLAVVIASIASFFNKNNPNLLISTAILQRIGLSVAGKRKV